MISRRTKFERLVLILIVLVGIQAFAANKPKLTNSTVIAKTTSAVALKPEGVRVAVELVPEERRKSQSLAARVAKLAPGKCLYLVFKNLQTNKQPEQLYHVYLNLEEGKKPAETDAPTGTLNFYNFATGTPSRSDVFFSFDVTDALKKLAAARQLSEPLTITIIPAEPPAEGVVPTVGQIELVEQ